MKVTAILPDDLVDSVKKMTSAPNLTESLITALRQWVSHQRLLKLSGEIKKKPLRFSAPDIAGRVRSVNRRA